MSTAPATASKHTPAPWTHSRMLLPNNATDRRCGFVVNGPDINPHGLPTRICDMRVPAGIDGFQEGEANARLIAAAPDLLHALYLALPYVEDATTDPAFKPGAVAKNLREIIAALTKADPDFAG